MKKKVSKFIVNILLCAVPISRLRKHFRAILLGILVTPNKHILIIHPDGSKSKKFEIEGLKINFVDENSSIIIHEPFTINNCRFWVDRNSHIEIGPYSYLNSLSINAQNSSEVVIGKGFTCVSCNIENIDEAGIKVSIGDNCMFSHHVEIRASDGHAIYDLSTGKPINTPHKGVCIGNNVWLGMHAKVLKNTNIPDNTVVGADSMVTKSFTEEHTIIAGSPAKVIKKGVNWCRENTDNLKVTDISKA